MAPPPQVGIDLVEPHRLAERLQGNPNLGPTLFTPQELDYCTSQQRPEEHLAARFCAKEAVIKALGIDGWDPLEVEVLSGGPDTALRLTGDVAATAKQLGVTVTISMSHLGSIAAAVALALPERNRRAFARPERTR